MSRWERYDPPTQSEWESHFCHCAEQNGGFVSGFQGLPYQRGAGFGSFLRGLFKMAVPLMKKAAKNVGKQAIRTGAAIAADVARGQDFVPALKEHGLEGAAVLADKVKNYIDKSSKPTATSTTQTGGKRKRSSKKPIKEKSGVHKTKKRKLKRAIATFPIFS